MVSVMELFEVYMYTPVFMIETPYLFIGFLFGVFKFVSQFIADILKISKVFFVCC